MASTSVASAGMESRPEQGRRNFALLDWRAAATALFVLVGCFLGSELGAWLRFPGEGNAIVFPPYAVLTAALLLSPLRTWWVLLLASLIGHVAANSAHFTIGLVLFSELANYTKALLAASAIRHINRTTRFDSFAEMVVFLFFAVFVAPAVAAFLGAFVLVYYNPGNTYWLTWRAWFFSNALAGATLLPALLAGITNFRQWFRNTSRARLFEAGLLAMLLLGISYLALIVPKQGFAELSPILYALLPFLLWAAIRFGPGGASIAILVVSCVAIGDAISGGGPFSATTENLLSLQFFLIVISIPVLFLAALIEERDRTEAILRERDERIGLAAETANLALWTIDFERGESWMSAKGRELFGFGPNERLSREVFLARVHPEDRPQVDKVIEEARAGAQTFEIEYRLLLPDGETRWLIARGRYLRNERGEISELMGVAIDLTAQIKASLEVRLQREEMSRLSRVASLGELTASLAHELNQPLAAIASNAAAGKRFLAAGKSDGEMAELLADVSSDARRAGEIIYGIRRLVRKGEGARCTVNLNEVIREVLRLLHSDLIGRATTVEVNLAQDLSSIQADPVQLQQVLLNLIMNAVEAMHNTPAPERRILISTQSSNGSVQVSVRDHGMGLPKDDPEKVFSKFFSTKPNGMGMGLTIVRSIVEAHGGELNAENLADGAHFFFHLPTS